MALEEKNYTNRLSIFTKLEEGQSLEVTVTSPPSETNPEGTVQVLKPGASGGYGLTTFVVTQPGIHTISVQKLAADGSKIGAAYETYKAFSYSKEYDVFVDAEACEEFLGALAESGRGRLLEEAYQVFEGIDKYLHITYDPRLPFLIAAIVLFLLDIAVRKFKFKWPHELVQDYKVRKELEGKNKQ